MVENELTIDSGRIRFSTAKSFAARPRTKHGRVHAHSFSFILDDDGDRVQKSVVQHSLRRERFNAPRKESEICQRLRGVKDMSEEFGGRHAPARWRCKEKRCWRMIDSRFNNTSLNTVPKPFDLLDRICAELSKATGCFASGIRQNMVGERRCFQRSGFAWIGGGGGGIVADVAKQIGKVRQNGGQMEPLPIYTQRNGRRLQYVWSGGKVKAVRARGEDGNRKQADSEDGVLAFGRGVLSAFFPARHSVTPDYWEFVRWRLCQRFFGSTLRVFGTQSLLMAVGIGAKKSFTASAVINWMMKDGLGKIARMVVAAGYGHELDSNLKRARFKSTLLYAGCMGCEILTPYFPNHFLLLAGIANVGKAITLTTFVSTAPAVSASVCKERNIADLTAKTQAQHMVVDSVSLAAAAALMHCFKHSEKATRLLPLVAYPVCAFMDVFCVSRELKAVELRTLNFERLEILANEWVQSNTVLSPKQVCKAERLLGVPKVKNGTVPVQISSLEDIVSSREQLTEMLNMPGKDKYMLSIKDNRNRHFFQKPSTQQIGMVLSQKSTSKDVICGFLHAAMVSRLLGVNCALPKDVLIAGAGRDARRGANKFMHELRNSGWETRLFSQSAYKGLGYLT